MSTTSLFVEVLVAGALAEVWIFLVALAIIPPTTNLADIITSVSNLSLVIIIPFIAFTYALGWAINYASEKILESYWDKKYKYPKYEGARLPRHAAKIYKTNELTPAKRYEIISGFFFQYASSTVVEDLRFGVHIVRISRSSAFNFIMIAAALLLHLSGYTKLIIFCIGISIVIAILVYFQGTTRFNRTHKRTRSTYNELLSKYDQNISDTKTNVAK